MLDTVPLGEDTLFINSAADRPLGCFRFGAIANSFAVNIFVPVFGCTFWGADSSLCFDGCLWKTSASQESEALLYKGSISGILGKGRFCSTLICPFVVTLRIFPSLSRWGSGVGGEQGRSSRGPHWSKGWVGVSRSPLPDLPTV